MALINASSTASILGITTPQVRQLAKAGVLKDMKKPVAGAEKHFGQFDLDAVQRLHIKFPDRVALMRLSYKQRGPYQRRATNGHGNADVIAALERVLTRLEAIEDYLTGNQKVRLGGGANGNAGSHG
jgi:hypothetical protein